MRFLVPSAVALAAVASSLVALPAAATGAETLTATFPVGTHKVDEDLRVTGQITGQPAGAPVREIDVQVHGSNGTWVTLEAASTNPDGTFSMAAPTWWVATQTMRAFAPATATDAALASTTTGTMTIKRSYKPRAGTAFTYLLGQRYRWNPCQVVEYRVNRKHAPRDAMKLIRWGFRAVSQATGLRFKYVGTTTFIPWQNPTSPKFPANADFVIGWSNPTVVSQLAGPTAGLGGAAGFFGSGMDPHLDQGQVAFDTTTRFTGTAAARQRVRKLLVLHEFGHAIGLGHVRDRRQVMYPGLTSMAPQYAAGDLRGLAKLSTSGGCLNVPARSSPQLPETLASIARASAR